MIDVSKTLVNTIKTTLNADPENKKAFSKMFHLGYDLKYMSKPQAMQFIVDKCDLVDKWLEVFYQFYQTDIIEQNTIMDEFEQETIKFSMLNLELNLMRKMGRLLRFANYNTATEVRLLTSFANLFS